MAVHAQSQVIVLGFVSFSFIKFYIQFYLASMDWPYLSLVCMIHKRLLYLLTLLSKYEYDFLYVSVTYSQSHSLSVSLQTLHLHPLD